MKPKIILIIPVLITLIISVIFFLSDSNKNGSAESIDLVSLIQTQWSSTQEKFSIRPTFHNQQLNEEGIWRGPTALQVIGEKNILARFEDDNNVHIVVLGFENGSFKILELFENQSDFVSSDWQRVMSEYGDSSYSVRTYTIDVVRNGEIVSFGKLTLVPENIFVRNYWENNL